MAKAKILVDLGKLKDIYSGLGQVSLHFGKALLEENNGFFDLTYLIPKGAEKYFPGNVSFEYLSAKRRYFPAFCKKYDLWHALHQDSAYMPGSKNALYLLTIHDLNFLEEKSQTKANARLQKLQKKVNRANCVTYISSFTKAEAEKNLRIGNKKQEVIYNGVEELWKQPQRKPDFLPEGEFLFTIGVVSAKKNFHVLVDMMRHLPDLKLIIAGNNNSNYAQKIHQQIQENNLQDSIIMPGKIMPEEKNYLLQHCKAFVFPSKNEGFGLPVIEAMQYGKPVFLSTLSALPETGGVHAFYWENFDAEYMAAFFTESMKYFSDTPNMAAHSIQYARGFSWEKNAVSYMELYKRLL